MTAKDEQQSMWTSPGEMLECRVDAIAFDQGIEGEVTLHLAIEEVLEQFDERRVLVASASEVGATGDGLSDEERESLCHPTYLIEETRRFDNDKKRRPEELRELVRPPISSDVVDGVRRSIFVDNLGISVGDFVELARGKLCVEQVVQIFRAVGGLFDQLHDGGWVHLGLTPWNVRIYEESENGDGDGFPRALIASSLGDTPVQDSESSDETDGAVDDEETTSVSAETSLDGDNPFADDQARTVVELDPIGGAHESDEKSKPDADRPASSSSDEPSSADLDDDAPTLEMADESFDSDADKKNASVASPTAQSSEETLEDGELSWSDLNGDTDPHADVDQEAKLGAVLDGIDRLFPMGTITDEIAVTPGFSAPELLSGMGSEDGESADIFSLGMFLYFLVAGVVPPASVYTRYTPAIPARNFRPQFPPGLQSVIARATRPQPEERFASVEAMLDAFEEAYRLIKRRNEVGSKPAPTIDLACDTHVGIAKRQRNPTNQDSVFSANSEDEEFALIVVADGVSTASYGSGDLASTALAEAAEEAWDELLPAYLMDEQIDEVEVILEILKTANHQIVDHVNEHHTPFRGSPHEVMGSTALVALGVEGEVTLASLGDSRAYLQRGAGIEQLTIDHNLWTLSILEGVEADSALGMPHGDALARCLGTFVIDNGELEAVDPEPDIFRFPVTDGDTLLLTTDGLVDFAGTNLLAAEDNILSVLHAEPDPALACLEFILLANRGGGGDNIGLSVARFY